MLTRRGLCFKLIALSSISMCLFVSCKSDTQATFVSQFKQIGADIYSQRDLSEFTRQWMVLPVPPDQVFLSHEIGGICFRPGTELNIDLAKKIREARNLKLLDVSGCKICDEFFEIVTNEKIEFIHVDKSKLSDEQCVSISKLPNLKFFTAQGTEISNAGLEIVRKGVSGAEVTSWYY